MTNLTVFGLIIPSGDGSAYIQYFRKRVFGIAEKLYEWFEPEPFNDPEVATMIMFPNDTSSEEELESRFVGILDFDEFAGNYSLAGELWRQLTERYSQKDNLPYYAQHDEQLEMGIYIVENIRRYFPHIEEQQAIGCIEYLRFSRMIKP